MKREKDNQGTGDASPREMDVESALTQLRTKLLSAPLKGGQPLKESALAREFGVSRASVREALNQLVAQRLVEYVPFCGFRVRVFTLGDLRDWIEMREAIEPIAARRLARRGLTPAERDELRALCRQSNDNSDAIASRRADLDFHHAIVRMSGNHRFADSGLLCYNIMASQIDYGLWSLLAYWHAPAWDYEVGAGTAVDFDTYLELSRGDTDRSHEFILHALEAGDSHGAEWHVRHHVASQTIDVDNAIAFLGDDTIPLERLDESMMKAKFKERAKFAGRGIPQGTRAGKPKE